MGGTPGEGVETRRTHGETRRKHAGGPTMTWKWSHFGMRALIDVSQGCLILVGIGALWKSGPFWSNDYRDSRKLLNEKKKLKKAEEEGQES
ncbi:hypothetical protein TrVE_jg10343 [Triparma verrucosa]|uniref:Uncharacterized protein n=1 Tax=Triparma verrucosa TaxID=1606542 RepID=A0A9W7EX84_9STRA|nr:hypothetical protein TrVE_jg10343 [Triparma verrucosa]